MSACVKAGCEGVAVERGFEAWREERGWSGAGWGRYTEQNDPGRSISCAALLIYNHK